MDNVAVPQHVLFALAREGADAAVEAVVLLVDRPRLNAACDLLSVTDAGCQQGGETEEARGDHKQR